jgi:hypothetical protein
MTLMTMAGREFGVPVQLLLAISYDQTRWERQGGVPSIDGGYGVMDLTAGPTRPGNAIDDSAYPVSQRVASGGTLYPLGLAARLLHVSETALKTDEWQNIRGAAAVLADYARKFSHGDLPTSLGGWYGAVASYSGATATPAARRFADGVYATLRHGAALTTMDGQVLRLPAIRHIRSRHSQLRVLGFQGAISQIPSLAVDCPSTLQCTFVPAAYAQDDPSNPGDYGNYDKAGRPDRMLSSGGQQAHMKIDYIIIHDVEGSYTSAINTFQNPTQQVSANYVIRSSDGAVTEMVRPRDVSWDAGNWYINMHSINIEVEGFAPQGSTWYTDAMYGSCATLVRYLAAKYGIPLDRQHILGHEDVPGPTDYYTSVQHWDPGPFWNWNHFMALVHGVSDLVEQASGGSTTRGAHHLATIDPTFATNESTVTDCPPTGCVTLPPQPANFVYLRTGPGISYPLIGDPLLHQGGGNGTTVDSDWGDKATIEETFVLAGQNGNWTAIWFAGGKAWFYNPPGAQQAALYTGGQVITPKPGLVSVPVYGAGYPESAAYPTTVPVVQVVRLSYTIPADQEYPVAGTVPTDYYYAATINSSLPDDHTIIIGNTGYVQISFNHRKFFVRTSDVIIKTLT